jgi:hypothetical protein
VIASALRRFERLKPAYNALTQVVKQDSLALAGNARLINWYKGAYGEEQQLRQDATNKYQVAQGKARRRGWLVALELAGLALAGYVIITK